jgi:hypothetical protein
VFSLALFLAQSFSLSDQEIISEVCFSCSDQYLCDVVDDDGSVFSLFAILGCAFYFFRI